jgi:beta-glucanase (GH16 family)
MPSVGLQRTIDLSAYRLTFDESFDRIDVSAWGPDTRWIAHTPWRGDFGDAQFTNPSPSFPFVIEDGILRIEARKGSDAKWRSGLLSSNDSEGRGFAQRYGYFEMRAKLPPGPGVWPAFWLIGDSDPSTRIEIDVLEYYGIKPDRFFSTVHVWRKPEMADNQTFQMEHNVPHGSLTSDFHTFGVSVEPDWLVFYHDRREIGRAQTPKELRGPLFVLINLALGSGYPIDEVVSPVHMYVDYVRAYRKK